MDEYELLEKAYENKDHGNSARENGKESDRRKERSHKHSSHERDREREHRHSHRDKDKVETPPTRGKDHRHRSSSRPETRPFEEEREQKRQRYDPPPPPKRRERTPPEVRELRERERELAELDRDTRTVFAYNLPLRAEERDVFEFFSLAGTVVDVRIIMDRSTRRSKGFAYIEYERREDIVKALALTGQTLMGQAVMVKSSEAEKNLAWEAQQQQQSTMAAMQALAGTVIPGAVQGVAGVGPCRLYVGGVHPDLSEADLHTIFVPFGAVESIQLQRDAAGRSQGIAHVTFASMSDATKAIQAVDGQDIAGHKLAVKVAALEPTTLGLGMGVLPPPAAVPVVVPESLADDEDDGGGMRLTSTSRAALMSRLAGASALGGATFPGSGANNVPIGAPVVPQMPAPTQQTVNPLAYEQGILGPASPIPTQCLLLKNMFTPEEETEPEWDQDIANDVKEECQKYGAVAHIWVDKNSKGFVYVKFAATESCAAAQRALNGRWFAGRQIVADFQFAAIYNSHFRI